MNVRALTLALAVTPVLVTGPALADAPSSAAVNDVDEARVHFQRGVKLYGEEDYRAALVEFRRAYAIQPSPAVLFNVGQSAYQLLEYAEALGALERYLGEGGDAIPADRRPLVEKEIAELRERVATVTLRTPDAGVEIAIDDVVSGRTPFAAPILVAAGRRKITATRAGSPPVVRYVDLAGRDRADVLLDGPAPMLPSTAPTVDAPSSPHAGVPTLAYVGFGIALAGAGVGTAFGLIAAQEKNDLEDACPAQRCAPTARPTIDALHRDATIATIGFGVGAAGLAAGLLTLLVHGHAADERTARAHVIPWIGANGAGLRGSF